MTLRRTLALVFLAAVAAPSGAQAAEVRVVAREVVVPTAQTEKRETTARRAPISFDMVGLHWQGTGSVWFRTAAATGSWSAWQPGRPEAEDLPDRGTAEARAGTGWKLGNPYWTGPARRIQYRLAGRVTRLRAYFISSPVEGVARAPARAGMPAIIRRSQWGADESIVRANPSYAVRLRLAVVHHTAGTNSYTAAQSAAIVRGIQRYHVLSNGWNDIGYNFLVDKYGQVFEGRGGGVGRNVVGAHAQGFNTGSVGVSVLGTYEGSRVSTAARSALVKLLAWRLDVGHVDPVSALTFRSYGNDRFPAGTNVRLRAVSGHRDTGSTSCPGASLYAQLPRLAKSVAARGLPKLYEPRARGALGGLVRFTARLSSAATWTVRVRNSGGSAVAQGTGRGTAVDWTWDSSAAPVDRYIYVIAAGPDTRPAVGAVRGPPPLAVLGARAAPAIFTPNGDGVSERTRISFSLTLPATVRVTVLASGTLVKTLVPDRSFPAGGVRTSWNGTRDGGSAAPDRAYRIRIAATAGSQQVVRFLNVLVDRTLGSLTVSPRVFSPNRDGRSDVLRAGFELTRPAGVRVHVLRGSTAVKRLFAGSVAAAGLQQTVWDGSLADGRRAPDGAYRVRVQATTSLGTRTLARRVLVDTRGPSVQVLSARLVRGVTRIRFVLSEPARLRVWYGTDSWYDGDSITLDRPAGDQRVWRRVRAGSIRIVARDRAGNVGRPVIARVVGG
jgi:flagellar hook assembly protein FlgD